MSMQRMEMPYKHLISKKNNTSKPYYMLAELIDNSISSWKENKMKEELTIDVIIDNQNMEISVTDDAYGMNKQELEDSIRLNKEKEGNTLNMFGVGLKNSAFWFGEDLKIETNNGKTSYETSIETSKILNKNETIQWNVIRGLKKIQGTKVTISNVYKDRLLSDTDFEAICKIFEIKYMNFIKEGVNIKMSWYKKGGGEISKKLSKVFIKTQVVPKEKKEDFKESLEKHMKNAQLEFIPDLFEQTIDLVDSNKPLKYKFDLSIKIDNKPRIIKMVIGIQDESNKKNSDGFKNFYGLITLQKNRAINFPPDSSLPLTDDYIRKNGKRLYGYCELGHIFRPDNNKQAFNFGEYKDELLGKFKSAGKEIELIADVVQSVIGITTKSKSGNRKDSISKIQNAVSSKSDLVWNVNNSGTDIVIDVDGEKPLIIKVIEISIEDRDDENYFINAKQVGKKSDATYEIHYNINHPIWKPLSDASGNSIDTKTVTYPIVAIMGMSSLGIRKKIISEVLGKEFKSDDIMSIINAISKVVIK